MGHNRRADLAGRLQLLNEMGSAGIPEENEPRRSSRLMPTQGLIEEATYCEPLII